MLTIHFTSPGLGYQTALLSCPACTISSITDRLVTLVTKDKYAGN